MFGASMLVLVLGCDGLYDPRSSSSTDVTPGGDGGGGSYDGLVAELEAGRTRFGGEDIDEMFPAGDTIGWLEYHGWDPDLHSLDTADPGARTVDYAARLSFDTLNVAMGERALAYAEVSGGEVTYRVYATGAADALLTEVTLPAPTDGQRWWAYAVDGEALYLVLTATPTDPDTKLFRVPAGGAPTLVTTFESAGCDVGEFWDLGVDGPAGEETVVFVESGRIWTLDVASNHAEWLGNEMQVGGTVTFAPDGVLFTAYDGTLDVPWFFDTTTRALVNVAEAIASHAIPIPASTDSASWYEADIARWTGGAEPWFVYGGNTGIFAYAPGSGTVVPVLLEPRTPELRVDYRYPVVTDNGQLFVTGLESTSGSMGADGPIWQVDLAALLAR